MLAFLAAALAASTQPLTPQPSADESPVLQSSVPWWEKITVTLDDKGTQHSCRYETSLSGAEDCDKETAAGIKAGGNVTAGLYKKLTFERRFSPGAKLDAGKLQPGDTLLGRQVMFLTIHANGSIESCKIVAATGDVPADYDCDEVRRERFEAPASADPAARQAFMTVLAYGHTEQLA